MAEEALEKMRLNGFAPWANLDFCLALKPQVSVLGLLGKTTSLLWSNSPTFSPFPAIMMAAFQAAWCPAVPRWSSKASCPLSGFGSLKQRPKRCFGCET